MSRSFYSSLRDSIEEVDGIGRELSRNIVGDLNKEFRGRDKWDIKDIDRIQGIVDHHLSDVYGPSRGDATRGKLYRTIYRQVTFTSNAAYERFFRDLDRRLSRYDRTRWQRLRSMIVSRGASSGGTFASLSGPASVAERRVRSRLHDPNRRWVRADGYRLSDRVWNAGKRQRRQINKIVQTGIRTGASPITVSRKLDKYLNPDHAAVVYKRNGQIVRRHQGTGGQGAYSSRRLMRTEMQYANATATKDATRRLAEDVPGVGITYALSNAHYIIDRCDDHAMGRSPGFERGTYLVEDVPMIPDHPHCMCRYEPYLPGEGEVMLFLEREYMLRP